MFALMLCTVHSWTTLLVTTRTDPISVRMESVWAVSSLREDDLQKKCDNESTAGANASVEGKLHNI